MSWTVELQPVKAPALAWCATVDRGGHVTIRHGPAVETADVGAVEGAWSGSFQEFDVDRAEHLMGSGGRLRDDCFVVAAPTHGLDRIFWCRRGDQVIASNSLVFLLRVTADRLRATEPCYVRDLSSYILGRSLSRDRIRTEAGIEIRLTGNATLRIGRDLEVTERARDLPPDWPTYDAYRAWLSDAVRALSANANDPGRAVCYRPISTVSSGYDSTAASVLAQEAGATTCLTIADARSDTREFESLDDSGAPVAAALGLSVVEFERDAYLGSESLPEAEFLASGTGGNDVILAGAEPYLGGTMLFTGFHGDKAWSRKPPKRPDGELYRGDTSGSSLLEFRLRVGFVHVPVPCLGAHRQSALTRISNDPGMHAWSIGGSYDRPIPRRLAESAGVPRAAFGQEKKAVGQPFNAAPETPRAHARPLEQLLTPRSLEDVRRHLSTLEPALVRSSERRFRAQRLLNSPLPRRAQGALIRLGLLQRRLRLLDAYRYDYPLTDHDYLLQWAIDRLSDRYPSGRGAALIEVERDAHRSAVLRSRAKA